VGPVARRVQADRRHPSIEDAGVLAGAQVGRAAGIRRPGARGRGARPGPGKVHLRIKFVRYGAQSPGGSDRPTLDTRRYRSSQPDRATQRLLTMERRFKVPPQARLVEHVANADRAAAGLGSTPISPYANGFVRRRRTLLAASGDTVFLPSPLTAWPLNEQRPTGATL
jgi:hypothetical protein